MLKAQKYLEVARKRGEAGQELNRVYRMIRCEELYLLAYAKLYSNKGATTKGTDPHDTVDGMSLKRIRTIIRQLEQGIYAWKPARRTYIGKPGKTKKRPLGLPCWSDKLLEQVIKMILETYYEPQFRDGSHGFRPNRGCHTALSEILKKWTGTKWFIELDIKGCFENIDHDILVNLLRKKIKDERFLKLLKGMLQAGYLDEWNYHETYSGTPQGGILSPLLANIVLNELDKFIEEELLPEYNTGNTIKRKRNLEYKKYQSIRAEAKKSGKKWEYDEAGKNMYKTPYCLPNDPTFKRLSYIRYADDSILGLIGKKSDAEMIKEKIRNFLKKIHLELSLEKTLITHARRERARFLNYDISVNWDNTKRTKNIQGRTCRSANGNIVLDVPQDVCKKWKKKVRGEGKEIVGRTELMNNSVYDIVSTYEVELQGLINYYTLAHTVYTKMMELRYFWTISLAKTLAGKFKSSKAKMYRKYTGFTADGRRVIMVKIERQGKKPLVAAFGRKPVKRRKDAVIVDKITHLYTGRTELIDRLLADKCELCGKDGEVQGHHIRSLKALKKRYEGKKNPPDWVKRMITIRRKTLFVCEDCHHEIHTGNYDGKRIE